MLKYQNHHLLHAVGLQGTRISEQSLLQRWTSSTPTLPNSMCCTGVSVFEVLGTGAQADASTTPPRAAGRVVIRRGSTNAQENVDELGSDHHD